MFFNRFPSFSAAKSARTDTQLDLTHTTHTAPTPSQKPSRLQKVLRALHLSRSQPKAEEEQYPQPQVCHVPPVALQPPCPATHQVTTIPTSARPSATSTPLSAPHSTFDSAQITLPRSAATTPATSYPNSPAASAPTVPLPTTYHAAATKHIADLELTVSRLERDNARQVRETNALVHEKLYPRITAFAEERDAEKASRKRVEDRLAEVIASKEKMEAMILKERERHQRAETARIEACFAMEKKNADLQAALLNLQARTDVLRVEELHKSLVRLGIVDPDDRQYPLAYPVCGDCITPFLKAVCTATKGITESEDVREPNQKQELARAGHRTFEVSDDEDGCSELVSEEPAGTLSTAPAPGQWFGGRSTRPT